MYIYHVLLYYTYIWLLFIYIYKKKFEWRPGQSRGHFAQVRFFFLFLKFPKCFIHHILIVLVLIFFYFFLYPLSLPHEVFHFFHFFPLFSPLSLSFFHHPSGLLFPLANCDIFFIFGGWLLGVAFVVVPHDHGRLWVMLLVVALPCNELFNISFATKSIGFIFSAYFRKCF